MALGQRLIQMKTELIRSITIKMSDYNFTMGQHTIDAIARDNLRNIAGTFPKYLTNISSRKSKTLTIMPPSALEKTDYSSS